MKPSEIPSEQSEEKETTLISKDDLGQVLTHEGLIDSAAMQAPLDYDQGSTELSVSIAAQKLNEIASQKACKIKNELTKAQEIIEANRQAFSILEGELSKTKTRYAKILQILDQIPNLPDDYHKHNADAVEAFVEDIEHWKKTAENIKNQ